MPHSGLAQCISGQYDGTHLRLELLGVHGRELLLLVALPLSLVLLELLRICITSHTHTQRVRNRSMHRYSDMRTRAPSSFAPGGTRPSG